LITLQTELPDIVIGDVLQSNIRPWKIFKDLIDNVIISSYEFLMKKGAVIRVERKGGLRNFLELDSNIKLWLDSGGFQIMKKGLNIPIEKVEKLYRIIDADYYISLDYPTTPNDDPKLIEKKIKINVHNFKYLQSKLQDKVIIPVIHYSPRLDDYRKLVRIYVNEIGCDIIAFGGFVPPLLSVKGTKKSRLKGILALQYLTNLVERNRVHVMGVGAATTISILNVLQIKSTDSAAWRVKAAYGKIILPWGGERHVTDRKVNFGRKKLTKEEFNELVNLINMVKNFPLKSDHENIQEYLLNVVFRKFELRALFNLWIVLTLSKKIPPKTGTFKSIYHLARNIIKLDQDQIEEIWSKLDRIKQTDLLKYINKN